MAINKNMATPKLFLLLQFYLKNQLKINNGLLITNELNKHFEVLMQFGSKEDLNDSHFDCINQKSDVIQLNSTKNNPFLHYNTLIPINHNFKTVAYLLLGEVAKKPDFEISPIIKNIKFIQTITTLVVVAFENKKLEKQRLINLSLQRDLSFAAEIQKILIPVHLPEFKNFNTAAVYQPQNKIGGDYFDVIQLNPDRFFFCLADISGKGISAALIMANFQAIIRSNIHHARKFKRFIEFLNAKTVEITNQNYFITFFGAVYNTKTKVLNYINAGHFPPFFLTENQNLDLNSNIPGLGMVDNLPSFSIQKIGVKSPTCIVTYTDGVTDVANEFGEFYGQDRLRNVLAIQKSGNPKQLIDVVLTDIKSFGKEKITYTDDLTLFAVHLE